MSKEENEKTYIASKTTPSKRKKNINKIKNDTDLIDLLNNKINKEEYNNSINMSNSNFLFKTLKITEKQFNTFLKLIASGVPIKACLSGSNLFSYSTFKKYETFYNEIKAKKEELEQKEINKILNIQDADTASTQSDNVLRGVIDNFFKGKHPNNFLLEICAFFDKINEIRALNMAERLNKIQDCKLNWQASAWYLERIFPQYFALENINNEETQVEKIEVKYIDMSTQDERLKLLDAEVKDALQLEENKTYQGDKQ